MRAFHLVKGEIRFLLKYGIVALYVIFTILYLCVLSLIPGSALEVTASILIFTDPAAMGLFFMGAVILLEKSQRVGASIAVSPVTVTEYIIAKVVPMMIIGCCVASALAAYARTMSFLCIIGVALACFCYSFCGLIVATKVKSLNGFMIAVVPFEMILFAPVILSLFGYTNQVWWLLHPGIAGYDLIAGKSVENTAYVLLSIGSLLLWSFILFFLCKKRVKEYLEQIGG